MHALVAGLVPILGHELGVESLLGGKEPGGGGEGKPPTVPPGVTGMLCLALLVVPLAGCASWFTPARGEAASELAACVFQHWGQTPQQIALGCGVDVLDVLKVQKAAQKYGVTPKCGAP